MPQTEGIKEEEEAKDKSILVTGREGPYGCDLSRLTHFV
jgi:hypothetical protein